MAAWSRKHCKFCFLSSDSHERYVSGYFFGLGGDRSNPTSQQIYHVGNASLCPKIYPEIIGIVGPKNYPEIMDIVGPKIYPEIMDIVVPGAKFELLLIQFTYSSLCFRSNASLN